LPSAGSPAKTTLELAGAGMPPALIYRAETGTVEHIPLKGMPLGSSVSYPYQITRTTVEPGDIVMLMTDGLAETFNPDKKMFGYERIERILTEMHDETPDRIIERLHRESDQWLNGMPQADDMTFFIFRRNPVPKLKNRSIPKKKLPAPVKA
jgi:serine phosphatase RsbU (regulator of sigma subunit)